MRRKELEQVGKKVYNDRALHQSQSFILPVQGNYQPSNLDKVDRNRAQLTISVRSAHKVRRAGI